MEKLTKILAQSGYGSRRSVETIIKDGRVSINGEVTNNVAITVSDSDIVLVDGKGIKRLDKMYFLLNKPANVLTSNIDKKRQTITSLIAEEHQKYQLFAVTSLGFSDTGAVLLTNDGDLKELITKNLNKIERRYLIRVDGIVFREKIRKLRKGYKDKKVNFKPTYLHIKELDKIKKTTLIDVVLVDASERDLNYVFENLGHKVLRTTRTGFAKLSIDTIKRGHYRSLTIHEVKKLFLLKWGIINEND